MHWIDPACLPETRGRVTQFLLNKHGELDGLVLDHERQVHFPPHLSKQVAKHIAPGDTIRVRGVKPRDADLIAAVSLMSKQGVEILDEGPNHDAPKHEKPEGRPMDVQGEVVLSLYGPKGELRGALLDDGTSLRMPPHAAAELIDYLSPGAHVQAWGHGVKTRHGRTLEVHEIAELVDADESA
ncbi:hypothetical protein [Caballeronia humi]|uniref:Uncharacterized protein n=1 Tax=Caballeronia humi TaxID=326474 RepID=A0A158HVL0_9BURK|nr:hypothetical protein [Caballeronia humi]SAL48356.1 hypothetical protein AWB65_03884 [Caballeronia humi]